MAVVLRRILNLAFYTPVALGGLILPPSPVNNKPKMGHNHYWYNDNITKKL